MGLTGTSILWAALAFWIVAWAANQRLAGLNLSGAPKVLVNLLIPVLFGATLLVLWEGVTRGLDVPQVVMPPPSMVWERIVSSTDILWADFQQTFLKAVIAGYVMGCGLGFVVAILVDRSPFWKQASCRWAI